MQGTARVLQREGLLFLTLDYFCFSFYSSDAWRRDMQACPTRDAWLVCTAPWQACVSGLGGHCVPLVHIPLTNGFPMPQLPPCTCLLASTHLHPGWVLATCHCQLWFPSLQPLCTYYQIGGGGGDMCGVIYFASDYGPTGSGPINQVDFRAILCTATFSKENQIPNLGRKHTFLVWLFYWYSVSLLEYALELSLLLYSYSSTIIRNSLF